MLSRGDRVIDNVELNRNARVLSGGSVFGGWGVQSGTHPGVKDVGIHANPLLPSLGLLHKITNIGF